MLIYTPSHSAWFGVAGAFRGRENALSYCRQGRVRVRVRVTARVRVRVRARLGL